MARKAYKPIIVYCTKGNEQSSIRFASVKEADTWISTAKKAGLIDHADIILDFANA